MKTTKPKATKTATKVSAAKTPTAIPTPKRTVKTKPATDAVSAAPKIAAPQMTAPRTEITSDLIAARAYIIWEKQGRPHGRDLANWLLAEDQLKQEIQSFTA